MTSPRIAAAALAAGTALLLTLTACQSGVREAAALETSTAPSASAVSPGPESAAPESAAPESAAPEASAAESESESEPMVEVAGAAEASWSDLSEVVFQAGPTGLRGKTLMRGQIVPINQYWASLYSLIGCIYDCTDKTFSFPTAEGPLTKLSKTPGIEGELHALMTIDGTYASGRPADVYPGQVYFTAAGSGFLGNRLRENGFTEVPLGGLVEEGVVAFQTPKNWGVPKNPTIGELRLFPTGSPLPAGFIPADGRTVDAASDLGTLLTVYGYSASSGKVAVPSMKPLPPFSWAIASSGMFPRLG